MKNKEISDYTFELRRKFLHILVGIIIISGIYFNFIKVIHLFIVLVFGIALSIISKFYDIPLLKQCLDYYSKPKERKKFPGKGVIFFFVGVILVLKLFTKDIALASIAILVFGDSVSNIIGRKIGNFRHPLSSKKIKEENRKLIEGSMMGTIIGFIAAAFFVSLTEAFIASLIAMIAEVVEFKMNDDEIDDNLIIPLVAGTVIHLIRLYF
jgi:dolichol kinase